MINARRERPSAREASSLQLEVIEAGLRDATDALPLVDDARHGRLSACAVRFDAHVQRLREARAARALPPVA
ncbi:MAG: hypothetical protein IVW36_04595 [Dehalococcoidia bacterium]|nr:hypothetical protein [Dehalococcoidia bacterium]